MINLTFDSSKILHTSPSILPRVKECGDYFKITELKYVRITRDNSMCAEAIECGLSIENVLAMTSSCAKLV